MAFAEFKNIKISGLSVVVPENEINIYDEAEYYDNSVKKIDRMRKMVGFYKRRVVTNDITPSDLAIQAAQNLIKEMNIDKNSIDALIFVVQQPDYCAPSTAYFIHQKLGLSKNCIVTDINQGCAGWVFGLFMVSQMIQAGTCKKVLLLNADTPSVGIKKSDRVNAPLFGDAGSATLLEFSKKDIDSYYNIETISDGFDAIINPFSGRRFVLDYRKPKDLDLLLNLAKENFETTSGQIKNIFDGYMNGMQVFDFTMTVVPENIKDLMRYSNCTESNIRFLCLHQANKQIVQTIATEFNFPLEKVPYAAFEHYGNNTMCSIPTTISLLDKNADKSCLCCSGFGNGLVCASAIVNLSDTVITDIKTFIKPDYIMSRDDYIKYWTDKMKG